MMVTSCLHNKQHYYEHKARGFVKNIPSQTVGVNSKFFCQKEHCTYIHKKWNARLHANAQLTIQELWLHKISMEIRKLPDGKNVNVNRYFLMEPSRKSHAIELSLSLWRNARWHHWKRGYTQLEAATIKYLHAPVTAWWLIKATLENVSRSVSCEAVIRVDPIHTWDENNGRVSMMMMMMRHSAVVAYISILKDNCLILT